MTLAALSVFEVANKRASRVLYEVLLLSELGGSVQSSLGMDVTTHKIEPGDGIDTLLVSGAMDVTATPEGVVAYLKQVAQLCRRVAAICLGAFALGDAELLNGRRVTTHWRYTDALQASFPQSIVQADKIFIVDNGLWTSAGMSAGIDLALGLVEQDHGREFARTVAAGIVVPFRRTGGHSQLSVSLQMDAPSDRVQKVLEYMRQNLRSELGLEELARVACLSTRQFTRVFREETGTTAAQVVVKLRLEAARQMIGETRLPLEAIATITGFADPERMRRAFKRVYDVSPQMLRNQAGAVSII